MKHNHREVMQALDRLQFSGDQDCYDELIKLREDPQAQRSSADLTGNLNDFSGALTDAFMFKNVLDS